MLKGCKLFKSFACANVNSILTNHAIDIYPEEKFKFQNPANILLCYVLFYVLSYKIMLEEYK